MDDETIEVGNRAWTLDEAEEVVAWSDGGGLGAPPRGVLCNSYGCYLNENARCPLTREHVEALRDFAMPWARGRDVAPKALPGETVRIGGREGVLLEAGSGPAHEWGGAPVVIGGELVYWHGEVFVRRPRSFRPMARAGRLTVRPDAIPSVEDPR